MKKILTMQDLSCFGQCSLTVALPLLSAHGVETCVLPTAILSNHTMFSSFSYLDLTSEMPNIFQHWQKNQIRFDGFYLGYLGKKELMDCAVHCFEHFSNANAPIIIDPCMGDGGKLYPGFDEAYVSQMRALISHADIILPNLTEACAITGIAYREDYDLSFCKEVALALTQHTKAVVVITGVLFGEQIGELIYDGTFQEVYGKRYPRNSHGTGDVFASVFTAHYLSGDSLKECCRQAGDFVYRCLSATPPEHNYGVCFESILSQK